MEPELIVRTPMVHLLVSEGLAGRHYLFDSEEIGEALLRDEDELRTLVKPEAAALARAMNRVLSAPTIESARAAASALSPSARATLILLWFQLLQRASVAREHV